MPPFAVGRIDHIVLRVVDLERSTRFYCDVLGLAIRRNRPKLAMNHLAAGPQLIDLIAIDGPLGREGGRGPEAEGRNLDHFCLRVDPFDRAALEAWLKEHGVPITGGGERFGAEGYGMSLYCLDPDGNTIELKGPATAG